MPDEQERGGYTGEQENLWVWIALLIFVVVWVGGFTYVALHFVIK